MKLGLRIMPKNEVLDSEGRAVQNVLKQHGFGAHDVRVGKYIEVEVEAKTKLEAVEKIQKMAEHLLYNPLIETYEIVSHETGEVLRG